MQHFRSHATDDPIEEARAQAARAIETRENANAVSIRLEGENARLRAQARALAEALEACLRVLDAHDVGAPDAEAALRAYRESDVGSS